MKYVPQQNMQIVKVLKTALHVQVAMYLEKAGPPAYQNVQLEQRLHLMTPPVKFARIVNLVNTPSTKRPQPAKTAHLKRFLSKVLNVFRYVLEASIHKSTGKIAYHATKAGT
mgnify:CR=1 FL=1